MTNEQINSIKAAAEEIAAASKKIVEAVTEPKWPYNNPREELKAPEGYEFTGEYRTPVFGECLLGAPGGEIAMDYSTAWLSPDERRLILRKKPAEPKWQYDKPREQLKAPDGYEFTGEYRDVKLGDWYLGATMGDYALQYTDTAVDLGDPRLILRNKPEPTVESVYGKPLSELKPPAGYAFTGEFRVASAGELLYASWGGCAICYTNPTMGHVLILRKLKRYVFEETGEVRRPQQGEWYVNSQGEMDRADYGFYSLKRPIVHKVEV